MNDDDFANPHARGGPRYSAMNATSSSHRPFPPEQLFPPTDPHIVQREKARIARAVAEKANRGSLDWALKLKAQEESGAGLYLCQARAWRAALGVTQSDAQLEAEAERNAMQAAGA
jgi:hypothetical protein